MTGWVWIEMNQDGFSPSSVMPASVPPSREMRGLNEGMKTEKIRRFGGVW